MKRLVILLALAVTLALPFVLRPRQAAPEQADVTLVIITPHNEAIRQEYGRGFKEWYHARTGKTVAIDWRVIGGTSEIARFLEGEYVASFENYWTNRLHKPWSTEVQAGFQAASLPAGAPALVQEARAAFLASEVSCGIDVFFGGGTPDFVAQAQAGRLVDAGLLKLHPDWFADAVFPQRFTGQEYWDKDGRWYGSVLSSYGIIFNRDSMQRLGFTQAPRQWADLSDPRLIGEVALCDPTKSGSINQAFENVIQQQMQLRLQELRAANPGGDPKALEAQAVREGWILGLQLMQRIGANARYFTDTSQKPPIDVAAGNCAAGMCIDFYGRQQAEAVERRDHSERVGFVSPPGGTAYSVDPIALLRGAPHREAAVAFLEYVLSPEGQKLWNLRPGTPGGPARFALRRLPVRRDFYSDPAEKGLRSDPDAEPYTEKDQLIYQEAWTGRLFKDLAFIVRIMCQDTHAELVRAWRAVNAAPEPVRSRALAAMQDLSMVSYERAGGAIHQARGSKDKVDEINMANELGAAFRRNYARAEEIARGR
ncbi:MAG TPA: extracellular solute-binding protein [Opitutaceae bacterium]|nr:extracellular solute-binding protein [Opitutaceae bacterium]